MRWNKKNLQLLEGADLEGVNVSQVVETYNASRSLGLVVMTKLIRSVNEKHAEVYLRMLCDDMYHGGLNH